MRTTVFLLCFLFLVLAGCGGGNSANATPDEMKQKASVAERNLVRIRDGVVAYYGKYQKAPATVDDLSEFKAGPSDLEKDENYADIGYLFVSHSLKFDDKGKLTQGWFIATPPLDCKCYKVRLNGVTGEFDYTAPDKDLEEAPGALPGGSPANTK
ncbi:MAG: hypothetical protein IT463_00630 [Planctomycetes bacterium]|nr:hypothetical protein [Planctomycetota bacterium]